MTDFQAELLRKSIHLSSIWMIVVVWLLSSTQALALFGGLLAFMLLAEILRKNWVPFAALYNKILGRILRRHEVTAFTGAFYVVLAAFLATALFEKTIAATALGIMLLSDSMAALIGKKFGKTRIAGKSLEGSLAFLLSALGVVGIIGSKAGAESGFYYAGGTACVAATLVELFAKKIRVDDNLTITLTAGMVMTLGTLIAR